MLSPNPIAPVFIFEVHGLAKYFGLKFGTICVGSKQCLLVYFDLDGNYVLLWVHDHRRSAILLSLQIFDIWNTQEALPKFHICLV